MLYVRATGCTAQARHNGRVKPPERRVLLVGRFDVDRGRPDCPSALHRLAAWSLPLARDD